MKPKAVLFDWDDTIVSGITPMVKEALKLTMEKMGRPPFDAEEQKKYAGLSARDLFGALFGDDWKKADDIYINAYLALSKEKLEVFPGAEDVLKTLVENKVYMAVVSTKRAPMLREEVKQSGFAHYFTKLVGAGELAHDKPHPLSVEAALAGSGIETKDVWFIGDNMTDIRCADSSGCMSILIETKTPPEDQLQEQPPKLRVKDHAALLKLVKDTFR